MNPELGQWNGGGGGDCAIHRGERLDVGRREENPSGGDRAGGVSTRGLCEWTEGSSCVCVGNRGALSSSWSG